MKKYRISLLILLLVFPLIAYSRTYTEDVLAQYFSVRLPQKIMKERNFTDFQNILQKKIKPQSDYANFGLHHGIFYLKDKTPLVWIYNNANLHHGTLAILNNQLETIYLKTNMGCLYGIELHDLLTPGESVFMVTHGAGGTGHYEQITDLIVFRGGVPQLATSVLKKASFHNALQCIDGEQYNLSDKEMSVLENIECTGHLKSIINTVGKKEISVDVMTVVKADETNLTQSTRDKINTMLKKEFNLTLNTPETTRAVIIEDLNTPLMRLYPTVCSGIIYSDYAWPTLTFPKK